MNRYGIWAVLAFGLLHCSSEPATQPTRSTRASVTSVDFGLIDCVKMEERLRALRGDAKHDAAIQQAELLRAEGPHAEIPLADLTLFHAPAVGQGRTGFDADDRGVLIFTAYTLCDPLTREIVAQHYIAQHLELRL